MIKVIIIDDHPIVLEGLKTLLAGRDDMMLAGTFDNGKAGLNAIEALDPNVVLLDINLPDIDGAAICKQVRKQDKDIRIIALSVHNERTVIRNMLNSGANAYVLKNSVGEEIINAIHTTLDGNNYLCRKTKEIMAQINENDLAEIPRITRREKEILELVSQGLTTTQIAEKLFISMHTVESHRKNLIEKFDVATMTAVIKLATKYGLI
ncbi:response regulator [Pseudobacter ginsenosidimutans]|uniref:LuxR family two component transcriptional regulator n=1 Tax=Pseudobacter ginsenosidimutans TaxID=661488 RepID=A0A4Q7N0R1_9BACT|nr:response regulator transcription factor [Pseudobacter ginsenosidimutans]QEC43766.1 response regulator transcription factor [Pseudobacter ginsenosidimutans]RZS75181.1 LuxR family two component transcriptional regulator [Pseudobacter ginsenosidimutans]